MTGRAARNYSSPGDIIYNDLRARTEKSRPKVRRRGPITRVGRANIFRRFKISCPAMHGNA